MNWSLKLGRVAGIPVFVHWTFLILLAFIGFREYRLSGGSLAAAAEGMGLLLAVFGCVVLHELGHALMARRFGVPTADITLLPIGGVARLQRMPERPAQELLVALAGPAVNVAIAAVLAVVIAASDLPMASLSGVVARFMTADAPFLMNLLFINLFLVLFNCLPAFPMDGGRVLRALLAMAMPYARATRAAATVGQAMAMLFGLVGLFGNPFLLLIALFVWIGAEGEARQAEERVNLRGVRVRDAMLTDYQLLSPDQSLGHAAELLLAGSQQDFPVLGDGDDHRPVGVLTRAGLMGGLSKDGPGGLVGPHAHPHLGEVGADAPLVPALGRLRGGEGPCLQVVDRDGRPVGLLTMENIGEFLMVRTALEGMREPGHRRQLARTFEDA